MTWQYDDLTRAGGGPPSVGNPAGYTVDADKTERVVHRGADGHIHELSFDDTWHHTDLTDTAQGDPPDSTDEPIGVILNDFDEPTVLYRSDVGSSALFAPDTPPEAAGGPTAVYYWALDNGMNVVYRSTDNHIHEFCFTTS
ncbi:hypothetical protein AQI95_32145 [Streptomyces yokosukanensis]|uniref:Uncharacterized protein n=1 Tax=Streptomyces yokosukanensis TaxID=67386 RepID=A0A101NXG8_9ACTN|nr:hypothetical protein [Streptomyces yokosukanensis]KUN01131.1 hypothetical protein AQI95_32145 [Streptomyces yokosukanensis]